MKVYLVGGAVRDQLLNRPVHERDWVVVGSTVEEMLQKGYRLVGKNFPVFLHPETSEEYALARTERKVGRGYKGFECYADPTVTLEEDLKRRDLTINAMAKTAEGTIIDPFGGQRDIRDKKLRHVSHAFVEDPLRVLRVARFTARYADMGFSVANETRLLMTEIVRRGEIQDLVPERVWVEIEKALRETQPQRFFEVLRVCGALNVILPEVEKLFGVPASAKWHPEIDTGVHTMMVLQQAAQLSEDTIVRFAALMHDVGKGITLPSQWPKHHSHGEMAVPLIKTVCKRLRIPEHYQQLAILVAKHHPTMHSIFELQSKTILKMLLAIDAFRRPQRLEQFLLACEADVKGRLGYEDSEYLQKQYCIESFEAAVRVRIDEDMQRLGNGEAIREALHHKRLQAMKIIVKKYKKTV